MASSSKDKPDDTSIKPVSSLRAQFEDISVSTGTPPPKSVKPAHLSHVEPERGRASLDMPRRATGWNGYEQSPSRTARPPTINTSNKPIARQLTSGSASRQRPVSMGPWSPPGSPPTLTIQTPLSPPKPLHTPTSIRNGIDVDSRRPDPSKSQASRSPVRSLRRELTGTPDLSQQSDMRPRQPSPAGFKKPPPPINRASKPATPTVSGFSLGLGVKSNHSKEKISPFSTPPSSDGSPEPEESPPRTSALYGSKNSSGYFQPPAVHHAVQARKASLSDRQAAVIAARNAVMISSVDPATRRSQQPSRADEGDIPPPQPPRPLIGAATTTAAPPQPPRPAISSIPPQRVVDSAKASRPAEYLPPPPKRNLIPGAHSQPLKDSDEFNPTPMSRTNSGAPSLPTRVRSDDWRDKNDEPDPSDTLDIDTSLAEAPDNSQANRRFPKSKYGSPRVWTQYDTRSLDLCGDHVCTGGFVFRAWNVANAHMITDYAPETKELKVTAFAFKPGSQPEEEGLYVWIGNNAGEIQEIDLKRKVIIEARPDAHGRREIVKMFRHQNSIWSLDDEGKLLIWPAGADGVPGLSETPSMFRLGRGHSASIIVKDRLWVAAVRNIHVYNPKAGDKGLNVTSRPLTQDSAMDITCAAAIPNQLDKVFFGHSDGKISFYSTTNFTCLGLISASPYKINCLAGAGAYLWAGFNTGMIYVYDTQSKPWKVKKEWQAHQKNPVYSLVVDLSSVWKSGHLQVASLGSDNAVCFWDGMLEDDWIENDMQQRDVEFCSFTEITAAIMTWNAGASTPGNLRHDKKDSNFFREAIRPETAPDILVFGFQELVDLENKKLTAKSIFKSSKKKDSSEAEHMSHQYRAWRDYLTHMVEDFMPQNQSYALLHTASMVGLFTCVFIKSSLRGRVRNLKVAEIKRGLGGLHGNKGAIILRFILDDTSLCFTNCHLAAGQTQTASRNADITAILEAAVLGEEKDAETRMSNFVGGGDGAMIMDHEVSIVNGDLNYRIDTMSRDTVIKAIKSSNLGKLLERDQLLVSRRRNPGFRLRAFKEQTISFDPTYKYDVGTDRFDTSDKGRSPAWCDRILYRGPGRIKQVDYRRHELKLSDHRPVSALFQIRIKTIDPQRRTVVRQEAEDRLADMREILAMDAKLSYLVNVLGVEEKRARKMLDQ